MSPAGPAESNERRRYFGSGLFLRFLGRQALSGPVIGLIAVMTVFIILIAWSGEPGDLKRFLGFKNLQVLLKSIAVTGVISLGALLIIIAGGIDLSVGSVVALVTVVTMQVFRLAFAQSGSSDIASVIAVPAGIAIAGVCGFCNGLVITKLGVRPFVTTLGMLSIARGLAVWLAAGQSVAFPGKAPGWVTSLAEVHVKNTLVNPGFWSLIALAFAVSFLLRFTVLGRYCYAIGSNEAAARLCGIAIDRNKIVIYTLAGLLTGWGGVLMFAQGGSGEPTGAVGLELDVIAAVVIGGASLSGGRGTVLGTLLGVIILGVLSNGVSELKVPVEIRYILTGTIIIVNTALSQWQRRAAE
jgi:ribose/xylose/arabinose/galactoside ABC-type transport system permease subunit